MLQPAGKVERHTCNAVIAASFSVMTQCSRSFSSAPAPAPPMDALLDVLLPNPILRVNSVIDAVGTKGLLNRKPLIALTYGLRVSPSIRAMYFTRKRGSTERHRPLPPWYNTAYKVCNRTRPAVPAAYKAVSCTRGLNKGTTQNKSGD